MRKKFIQIASLQVPDDNPYYFVRRDLSGGQNTRQDEQIIGENQATVLQNVELNTAGQRSVITGSTLIEDLSNDAGTGAYGFEPEGGTNELLVTHGTKLEGWTGSGTFTEHKIDFTTGLQTTMVRALESDEGDVVIISNGTDNCFRMAQNHTFQDLGNTNTSPPLTTVMEYYRDRLWALNDNKLYYSGAIPTDYSDTFSRSANYYNIPVGEARALKGTRDYGLIIFGDKQIYQLNPTLVPAPATDKPELVLDIGCANGNTVQQVADDYFYLSYDGVRAVRRTVQDKLQQGQTQPLSWNLKTEFDDINWAYISKACAMYFRDRYILSLPTGSATYNNQIWIFYPALNAWTIIDGLNISRMATVKINSEQRLYGIDSADGSVYRLFYGTSFNGTAIVYQEEGRAEDFNDPMKKKIGGEFKIKVEGQNATISAYANLDGSGYQALDGNSLVLASGGVDFNFDFPFNFGFTATTNMWHYGSLGEFKRAKFKIYCATKNAQIKILESLATANLSEYQSED